MSSLSPASYYAVTASVPAQAPPVAAPATVQQGQTASPPPGFSATTGYALGVSVEGLLFSYSLTEDDLTKVFSRYGRLQSVEVVLPTRQFAIVTFVHLQDAELAVRDLNHKVLTGVHGRLVVHWASHELISKVVSASPPLAASSPDAAAPAIVLPVATAPAGTAGYSSSPDFPQTYPGMHSAPEVRKYTARFDIGIDNEKEFQVARRLIGVKGQHMKQINKETEAKLRLRGKGSGYLEGVSKTESPEPLHLCVSCVSHDGYQKAVSMVSVLLESVYEDYRKFCRNKNLPSPTNLTVAKKEAHLTAFPPNSNSSLLSHRKLPDSPSLINPHDL